LLRILPIIVFKLYNGLDIRVTSKDNILPGNIFNFFITQNINGQARILFILQLFSLILFKKFISSKKNISNIFFLLSLLLFLIILLMESRFIILFSGASFFYIIISIINLDIKRKIFYLLLFFSTLFFVSTLDKQQRFFEFNEQSFLIPKIFNTKEYINTNLYSLTQCSVHPSINKIDSLLSGRLCGWEILIKNIDSKDLFFGRGFFADQKLLAQIQKTSSNSWVNILFNTGIISLVIISSFTIFILFNFFKFKNINNKNIYVCFSNYLLIFILCRSLFEDTIAFVNIDLMIIIISVLLIKNCTKETNS
jgi:hypothetical protein